MFDLLKRMFLGYNKCLTCGQSVPSSELDYRHEECRSCQFNRVRQQVGAGPGCGVSMTW